MGRGHAGIRGVNSLRLCGDEYVRKRERKPNGSDEAGSVCLREENDVLVGREGAHVGRGYGAWRKLCFFGGCVKNVAVLTEGEKVQ